MKLFLSLVIPLFLVSPVQAFDFAVLGGANSSWYGYSVKDGTQGTSFSNGLSGNAVTIDQQPNTGSLFGITFTHAFFPRYSLEAGVFYQSVYNNTKSTVFAVDTNTQLSQTGILVPILVRTYFFESKILTVGIGPYFSQMVGTVNRRITLFGTTTSQNLAAADASVNAFDLGACVSAALNYEMQKDLKLILDVRYFRGFTNLSRDANANAINQSLQVLAGVSYSVF